MNGFMHRSEIEQTHSPSTRRSHLARHGSRLLLSIAALCTVGCIERTITINTEPQDATVLLNDQEVGRSPVRVPFTWYGDYDIIVRKKGYKAVHTHHNVRAPWYELPGIDIVTECLIPFTVHDDRVLETIALEPAQPPSKDELLNAAAEMRQRALAELP